MFYFLLSFCSNNLVFSSFPVLYCENTKAYIKLDKAPDECFISPPKHI